jgi:hypothetical protein
MKTSVPLRRFVGTALGLAAMLATTGPLRAIDLPDPAPSARSTGLGGYYKVSFSSDPIFPATGGQEWFLDFGEGVRHGRSSGTVAVSSRQNPHVRVHLLVWQVFPESGTLVIGKQTDEGSRRAVALANWKLGRTADGLSLQRGGFQVSLRRAQAGE